MSGIYGIMYTGRSALLAAQAAISATGNNIANADTEGYSRQTVVTSASDPFKTTYGLIGTGVDVSAVTRAQDTFLEKQIVAENENLGRWDALSQALSLVETVFSEDDDYGLNAALSAFWNGSQDLADNPDGDTERSALISSAQNLADTFTGMSSSLREIQRDIETSVDGVVEDINDMAGRIADLNQQIARAERDGQSANTYRDSRDALLEELSQLIDVNYYETDNGMVTVQVAGGANLVEGTTASSLSAEVDSFTGDLAITLTGSDGGEADITDKITGGELKGWIEARDEHVAGYLDSLDELAAAIMSEVNALHASGYGLDGSTGYALFTGSSAVDMAVNQDLIDDHALIAASATSDGVPGDNGTALAIAALGEALVMDGGESTFAGYYSSLVGEVGSAVETAESNVDYYTDVAASLDNLKQSITGVSIDEETVNLVMLQSAYDAAAKIINIVDEMLNTLLDIG